MIDFIENIIKFLIFILCIPFLFILGFVFGVAIIIIATSELFDNIFRRNYD